MKSKKELANQEIKLDLREQTENERDWDQSFISYLINIFGSLAFSLYTATFVSFTGLLINNFSVSSGGSAFWIFLIFGLAILTTIPTIYLYLKRKHYRINLKKRDELEKENLKKEIQELKGINGAKDEINNQTN